MRKTNAQVLQRKKNQQMDEVSRTKISTQQVPRKKNHQAASCTKNISFIRIKLMYKFHEENNQHTTSFKDKNKQAKSSVKEISKQ